MTFSLTSTRRCLTPKWYFREGLQAWQDSKQWLLTGPLTFCLYCSNSYSYTHLVTSAEREVKRIRTAQECFKVASGGPEVASELVRDISEFFDLFSQGKEIIIGNYKEELIITFGRNKKEIGIISGLPRVWTGLRVTRQIRPWSGPSCSNVR